MEFGKVLHAYTVNGQSQTILTLGYFPPKSLQNLLQYCLISQTRLYALPIRQHQILSLLLTLHLKDSIEHHIVTQIVCGVTSSQHL